MTKLAPALLSVALFVSVSAAALAQTAPAASFQSIPPAEAAKYHFDFQKNFFPTDAAFQAAVKKLNAEVVQIQSYQGKVLASPQNLYTVLKLSDDFDVLFSRVYWYLNLQYSVNTKDTAARDKSVELDSTMNPKLSFITTEVQEITPAQLKQFMTEMPKLKLYDYSIEQAVRYKPHTLTAKEEEVLGTVAPMMTQWESDEFDLLMDRAPWGKVHDPDSGQDLDVRQDEGVIDNSPLREVRKEGFDKEHDAYKAQRDLFAFDVMNIAKAENKLSQLRHYKNGQDSSFFALFLSYPQIDNAYNVILSHGDLNKQFQTMRRNRIASFTGFSPVHAYDLSVVPPGVVKPRFDIDQATKAIEASTGYLGPEWNGEIDNLLDPANGRLDIVPGPNRVPNAFSVPVPQSKSVFYSYGYQGYLQDVVTLAHESGHVVHNGLQNNNHVPPSYADGPRFFTESYAILDEYVIMDSLYQHETDPGRKIYYLEQLMQDMFGFYGTTRIADIEKVIYEGVDNGTIKNADDLDKLTHDIAAKTSIWPDIDPEVNDLWEEVPHYYSSPTYYVNYVFATLLSETYFSMYKKDPIGFGKKFTALERNGFNDTPDHLLKRFLGIDMQDPKTYDAVFAQQQQYLTELQSLYDQAPVSKPAETAGAGTPAAGP